ncbi:MAG: hypothetical protein H6728_01080 [Myxococcales bacterium]|nr:hypothetical protein [Myxococcales bacterium]
MAKYFFTSLTRISDLSDHPFQIDPIDRSHWEDGDYIVGRVAHRPNPSRQIELTNGRMVEVLEEDLIVGALGRRFATLEAVGDWRAVGEDLVLDVMTGAGLLGKITSISPFLGDVLHIHYVGHATRNGTKLSMDDFRLHPKSALSFSTPSILLVGTSMSAGKTTAGRQTIHLLKEEGLKVIGAKLTGAGRYRDIKVMQDAGADAIFDFVDVGLPSSIHPEEDFRQRTRTLLSRIQQEQADVLVVEAGASPLEPYNGAAAIEELGNNIKCTVLCASDPYAVLGVMKAFGRTPDIVAGVCTNTTAGIQLIEKLTQLRALNFLDPTHLPPIKKILLDKLFPGA